MHTQVTFNAVSRLPTAAPSRPTYDLFTVTICLSVQSVTQLLNGSFMSRLTPVWRYNTPRHLQNNRSDFVAFLYSRTASSPATFREMSDRKNQHRRAVPADEDTEVSDRLDLPQRGRPVVGFCELPRLDLHCFNPKEIRRRSSSISRTTSTTSPTLTTLDAMFCRSSPFSETRELCLQRLLSISTKQPCRSGWSRDRSVGTFR